MTNRACVLSVCYDQILLPIRTLVLESRGHSVIEASSQEKALEALAGQSFKVLVLDGGLPETDCVQFLEALAKNCSESHIVFLGGRLHLRLMWPATTVFVDPYSPAELLEAVGIASPASVTQHSPE